MGHHYVPREYLRGFEDPNDPGKIWMYDKCSHRFVTVSIASAAQEADYYSEDTERNLSSLVEGPGHRALKRFRQGDPISRNERIDIAFYMATLLMRGPRRRRKAFEMLPGVVTDVIDRTTSMVTNWAQTSAADDSLKQRRFSELAMARKKFQAKPPGEIVSRIRSPWPAEKILRCVIGMTWRIVTAVDTGFFITSDNPVFYFDAFGLGCPESELTFPLAFNMAMLGSWQGRPEETIFALARPALVKEVNRRIAGSAERFVFYFRQEEWVAQIAEKKKPFLSRIKW